MLFYFGEPWYDLLALEGEKVPEPLGEPCLHCSEPVVEGESGELTVFISAEDGARIVPLHDCCAARSRIGSVGHQLGRCSCQGGHEDDPAGMTIRQAAEAAFALWQEKQRKG